MGVQAIKVPGCSVLGRFIRIPLVRLSPQRSASMREGINDTIRMECAPGRTGFSVCSDLDGQAAPVEIPKSFCQQYASGLDLSRAYRVPLVLSPTYLSDGTGVGLLAALAHLPVTAFLCLPVENSCLWLPTIDLGKKCLGLPALRPLELARTLEPMARCLSTSTQASYSQLTALVAGD